MSGEVGILPNTDSSNMMVNPKEFTSLNKDLENFKSTASNGAVDSSCVSSISHSNVNYNKNMTNIKVSGNESADGATSGSDAGIGRLTSHDSSSLMISPPSSQISPNPTSANGLLNNSLYITDQGISSGSSVVDGMLSNRQFMANCNYNSITNNGDNNFDCTITDSKFMRNDDLNEFSSFNPNEGAMMSEGLYGMNKSPIEQNAIKSNTDNEILSNLFNPWNAHGDTNNIPQNMNDGFSPVLSGLCSNGMTSSSSSILASIAVAKRAITGGHQMRNNAWGSNTVNNTSPTNMKPAANQNDAYYSPWAQALQQKGNSGDSIRSNPIAQNNGRPNMINNPSVNNNQSTSPLGVSKNPANVTSSNSNNMYSMFPKRPQHRMMAFWKQRQLHQQNQNGAKLPNFESDNSAMGPNLIKNLNNNGSSDNLLNSNSQDTIMNDLIKSMDNVNINNFLNPNNVGVGNNNQNIVSEQNATENALNVEDPNLINVFDSHNANQTNGSSTYMQNVAPPKEEGFSRKVFVGGLPPDIDEGYCFLLFVDERSVQTLINACIIDEGKYYWCVSSPTMKDKPVQIRPWNLADSDYVMDAYQHLDPRKTIFVGGVPRPLKAVELALIMDRLYGSVCYAGIDTDPDLKYPKGAGRVAFSSQQSYIAAISARFVQLQHSDIDKRVEVKPYVLDNQMCDECQGARCSGKFAPFFCANVTCLQYYCEQCWVQIHSRQGREYHKPLVKEGADRPRPTIYRW